jgi:hypothetical protein
MKGAIQMFDSVQELSAKLTASGYFIDSVMTMDIFLAVKLRKPVILEGQPVVEKQNWRRQWQRPRARI